MRSRSQFKRINFAESWGRMDRGKVKLQAGMEGQGATTLLPYQGPRGLSSPTLPLVAVHEWSYKNSSNMSLFARHHGDFRKAQANKVHQEKETTLKMLAA